MRRRRARVRWCCCRCAAPQINLLYDSECPLCLHEVRFLEKRDIHGAVKFTDLADLGYDETAAENGRVDFEEGMKYIHAVTRKGEVRERVSRSLCYLCN
jgi:predicted DCC family thiol-disulfide oxidoreductase YuxK